MVKKNKIKNTDHSFILFFIILFMVIPTPGTCNDYKGNLSLTAGSLITRDKFSSAFNTDRKFEMGISFDLKKKSWPIRLAFDSSFLHAESETKSNSYNLEEKKNLVFFRSDLGIGVKKFLNLSSVVKPFLGSGIYLVRIYGEMAGKSEIVAGIGYWIGAGVYFNLPKHFICGFQWKKSKADIKIFNVHCNSGGDHFSLMAGFHF